MPTPLEVYEAPDQHWQLLTATTDDTVGSQHFDRKGTGWPDANRKLTANQLSTVREEIVECISAFANANADGGLVIVGISGDGTVVGVDHLDERQLNSLQQLSIQLRCYRGRSKLHDCQGRDGHSAKILLHYVPSACDGICETTAQQPKAWIREGRSNTILNDARRQVLLRERGLADYERIPCAEFDPEDVDSDLFGQFRASRGQLARPGTEQYLYEIGALERVNGRHQFNNAGLLFFARNPQRAAAHAYLRLLRYESALSDEANPGPPTLDRRFDGCLPQQIRKIRVFFRESGFFKSYQVRRPAGGFEEEPELPPVAVDEAIVNAVVHRDYAIALPIECIRFSDGLIIRNPGRVLQRGRDLPERFTLDDIALNSMPRNSKLVEWFREMRDDRGVEFVRMLAEGTLRMKQEMEQLGLPAPEYLNPSGATTVVLRSRSAEREARLRAATATDAEPAPEILNAFLLVGEREGMPLSGPQIAARKRQIQTLLVDALTAHGWYVDRNDHGQVVVHRRGLELAVPPEARPWVRFYPAYSLTLREYHDRLYFVADYRLEIKAAATARQLLTWLSPADLCGRALVREPGNAWNPGRVIECGHELSRVEVVDQERTVRSDWIIPSLSVHKIRAVLRAAGVRWDFDGDIKRHSLVGKTGQARVRLEKTLAAVQEMAERSFPLRLGAERIVAETGPARLVPQDASGFALTVLPEPPVVVGDRSETTDIRDGITRHGVQDDQRREVEIIPVCLAPHRDGMAALIERLRTGKFRFKGSERTFHLRLQYGSIITVPLVESIQRECERLLREHPEWAGNPDLNRLFLVHVPESGFELDDEQGPYYATKRVLLENGLPCQMVDTPTIIDPDWKDLNLALNISAKCGITPWVLPDRIPDADFFVGLSYTRSRRGGGSREMGYATVFNSFGRWEFYSGSGATFAYEERGRYFGELVEITLGRLENLPGTPTVYFHYSARFSREDRATILAAARRVRPGGTFAFVSINLSHNLRLYDLRPEGDGSLARGTYVVMGPRQVLLSTTGYNALRKTLGTPTPLELTAWRYEPGDAEPRETDLRSVAVQILSLTKLNWASTESLCGEPITTKYAGDIAYLTAAFLRQGREFRVHPVLERTAWFI